MSQILLDRQSIERVIPHREPFLFLDEVWLHEEAGGRRALGKKRLTGNEPFFAGHFPGRPIMPGVLIIEAIAQTGACLMRFRPIRDGESAKFPMLLGSEFRFFHSVYPGSILRTFFEMRGLRTIHNQEIGSATGYALVDDTVVAEGKLTFVLVEAGGSSLPTVIYGCGTGVTMKP